MSTTRRGLRRRYLPLHSPLASMRWNAILHRRHVRHTLAAHLIRGRHLVKGRRELRYQRWWTSFRHASSKAQLKEGRQVLPLPWWLPPLPLSSHARSQMRLQLLCRAHSQPPQQLHQQGLLLPRALAHLAAELSRLQKFRRAPRRTLWRRLHGRQRRGRASMTMSQARSSKLAWRRSRLPRVGLVLWKPPRRWRGSVAV